jgi:PAS domain S-box-containing protein
MDELLNSAPCGFVSLTDEGSILEINQTLLNLLEYELNELQNKHLDALLPLASRIFCQTHFWPMLKLHNQVTEIYFSLRSKRGDNLPMLINALRRKRKGNMRNDCIFMPIKQRLQYEEEILQAKKIAEAAIQLQKEAEEQLRQKNAELLEATRLLEQLVNTDGLTQIANRRCFDLHLEMEWLRLQREQGFLSVILFDIDYFKRYNDTYGHQQGDRCLYQIAQAVQGVIKRPADLFARYGGEEFAVILPNTPSVGALVIAERIHRKRSGGVRQLGR